MRPNPLDTRSDLRIKSPMRFCFVILSFSAVCCSLWSSVESALRATHEWRELDVFQKQVSRDTFETGMDSVYAPNADWREWMQIEENGVWIETGDVRGGERYWLEFSAETSEPKLLPKTGLEGLRIALDPGHLGGEWGAMEERSFREGEMPLVQEGDLVLAACEKVARSLRERGAKVWLTRESPQPTTDLRPEDFLAEAVSRLSASDLKGEELSEAQQKLAERLFYRTAEIRARADALRSWNPDLAVVLHINASNVEEPEKTMLHEVNDAHILVNGCFLGGELADPTQRFELLWRLLNRYQDEEHELAFAMRDAMRAATGLPAYTYSGSNAKALDIEGFIYARNLQANRIYDCPVVYLEPWQANSVDVYEWAAAGDYEGLREFSGKLRPSLPTVYANFVVRGLLNRFEP